MDYIKFLEYISKKAGKIMKKNFQLGMKKEIKKDFSPLTITDIFINELVIEEIKKYFPYHNVKGEEQSLLNNDSKYLWVCDPIDGTIPFSCGFPISTFSLALVYNGNPIAGVIYDPFLERLLIGEKGKGTYLNGKQVFVNNKNKVDNQTLISLENFNTALYDINKAIIVLTSKGIKYFQFCSVLYGAMMVCAGETDAVIFPHYTSHDGASLKILIEEAGGKMTDLFGGEQRYDRDIKGYIASNGKIHQELVDIVSKNL